MANRRKLFEKLNFFLPADSLMKTQVELRSFKFPRYKGEEKQINPGVWGRRLAEYLVQKLSEKGIQTDEIIAEDCG